MKRLKALFANLKFKYRMLSDKGQALTWAIGLISSVAFYALLCKLMPYLMGDVTIVLFSIAVILFVVWVVYRIIYEIFF